MNCLDLFSLKNRCSLVVGGAGLLGSQISEVLAEFGSNVIVASRNEENSNSFIQRMKIKHKNLNFYFVHVDINDPKSIIKMTKTVKKITNNSLDILVNCGWSGNKNTFESISDEDWDYDINICLNGVFKTIKNIFPLLKNGTNSNILNIASMYGHVAPDYRLYDSKKFANPPSYGSAKAGIIQLTKYLSSFLSPYQIRVNCISPGPFPFESTQSENPEFIKRLSSKNPLNRIGKPYEIKGAAIVLCSNAGSYMTGQNICVDGGWSIW